MVFKSKLQLDDLVNDMLAGKTNQEIADSHGVTLQCVKQRLYTEFKKYGVRNRVEYMNTISHSRVCPHCGKTI